MKKIFAFCIVLAVVLSTLFSIGIFGSSEAFADNEPGVSWYDEKRAPEFYGATEIALGKNAVSEFDIKDSRFRIFAKDFEDGDLTKNVECTYNDVDVTAVGDYTVKYRVTDSHGNFSEISVPVRIVENDPDKITVVRTIYSVARLSHLKNVGVERCDNGDRQSLGIFLPAESEAQITVLDSDVDLTITCFTNTRAQNSFVTLKKDVSTAQSVKNVRSSVSYACVPLISSPRLAEDGYPDKTYKISVQFDSSVKALDHYHYGDDEETFKNNWKQSKNEFGLIDGEAILFVLPFADVDKIDGSFENADEMLDYFKKVVDKYDRMIGLSLNPNRPSDQNFRTKYTAVGDSAMSGIGAYYESTFIAVCSQTTSALYQYGWGTLHEIAHGYQGLLGRGNAKNESLYLNETGNNILAHYVQIDKSIYKANHDWMGGTKEQIETANNQKRLNGEQIFTNAGGTYTNTGEKLYCLVNLFDAFEGEETYAKLFSSYRAFVKEYGTNVYTIADFYALFFAENYNANILPYLKDWTISVSESVQRRIYSQNLDVYSITSSVLTSEETENYKKGENVSLNYGLITNATARKYGDKTALSVSIEIDDFSKIRNKNAVLCVGDVFDPNNSVQTAVISSDSVAFNDISVGSYLLRMPTIIGYDSYVCPVTLKNGENHVVYRYSKHTENDFLQSKFVISGIHGTVGFAMTLEENNTKATVTLGGADLGNRNSTWEATPDATFVSITVSDENGNPLYSWVVKGNSYFSDLTNDNPRINLKYGYRLSVYAFRPQGIGVYYVDKSGSTRMQEYDTAENQNEYTITENGLKKNNDDFDEKAVIYEYAKKNYIDFIQSYLDSVEKRIADEKFDETTDKGENLLVKNQVISAYEFLDEKDRTAEHTDFVQKIKKGGSPIITIKSELITVRQNELNLDFSDYVFVTDAEDVFVKNVVFDDFSPTQTGRFSVGVTATDSDGNITRSALSVSVVASASPDTPIKQPTGKPVIDGKTIAFIVVLCLLGASGIAVGVTFIVIKNKKKDRKDKK